MKQLKISKAFMLMESGPVVQLIATLRLIPTLSL